MRTVLDLRPQVNRGRLIHYGGSQGGHIALLSGVFAPDTFAFIYATSPLIHLSGHLGDPSRIGRGFMPHEFSVRNVLDHVERIKCPVFVEHGTADPLLPHDEHTGAFAEKWQATGRDLFCEFIEGGDHGLTPVTTRMETLKRRGTEALQTWAREAKDDFAAGRTIDIPCADRVLRIDWSKPPASHELAVWLP